MSTLRIQCCLMAMSLVIVSLGCERHGSGLLQPDDEAVQIFGTITSAGDGSPIPQALIQIGQIANPETIGYPFFSVTRLAAVTDSAGQYRFTTSPCLIRFRAWKSGYYSAIESCLLDTDPNLDFELYLNFNLSLTNLQGVWSGHSELDNSPSDSLTFRCDTQGHLRGLNHASGCSCRVDLRIYDYATYGDTEECAYFVGLGSFDSTDVKWDYLYLHSSSLTESPGSLSGRIISMRTGRLVAEFLVHKH